MAETEIPVHPPQELNVPSHITDDDINKGTQEVRDLRNAGALPRCPASPRSPEENDVPAGFKCGLKVVGGKVIGACNVPGINCARRVEEGAIYAAANRTSIK